MVRGRLSADMWCCVYRISHRRLRPFRVLFTRRTTHPVRPFLAASSASTLPSTSFVFKGSSGITHRHYYYIYIYKQALYMFYATATVTDVPQQRDRGLRATTHTDPPVPVYRSAAITRMCFGRFPPSVPSVVLYIAGPFCRRCLLPPPPPPRTPTRSLSLLNANRSVV